MNKVHDDEQGWVMIIAIVVMVLMLGLGLTALKLADGQQKQSRVERERETALNLAEGLLYAQSFILAAPPDTPTSTLGWPTTASRAYNTCTNTSNTENCPDDQSLANASAVASAPATFQGVDTVRGATWTSVVMDNGTGVVGSATNPSTDYANADPNTHWDANGDKKVWIKATGNVHTSGSLGAQGRTVVGLMGLEQIPVQFPRTAVIAGSFKITPSGNGPYVDTGGTTIQIRCTDPNSSTCAGWDQSKPSQVTQAPGSIVTGYSAGTVLSDAVKDALKSTAIANKTYFAAGTCPTGDQLTGAVVYVENCTASYGPSDLKENCTFQGQAWLNCANGVRPGNPGKPAGMLVWNKGVFGLNGNVTFIGVVYHLNGDNCGTEVPGPAIADGPTCPAPSGGQSFVVQIGTGGTTIVGAVAIDGAGGVQIGANGLNVVYNPNVFNDISAAGTTGLVQNSWRELTG